VSKAKLPRILGILGVAVGLGFMAIYWYIYKYDPFHFPPVSSAGNYSPPRVYDILEDSAFTLVPGIWLGFFTMDLGPVYGEITWVVAALINFPIYYCLGWAISKTLRRLRPSREERPVAQPLN
jgi:hypothetical protein